MPKTLIAKSVLTKAYSIQSLILKLIQKLARFIQDTFPYQIYKMSTKQMLFTKIIELKSQHTPVLNIVNLPTTKRNPTGLIG